MDIKIVRKLEVIKSDNAHTVFITPISYYLVLVSVGNMHYIGSCTNIEFGHLNIIRTVATHNEIVKALNIMLCENDYDLFE